MIHEVFLKTEAIFSIGSGILPWERRRGIRNDIASIWASDNAGELAGRQFFGAWRAGGNLLFWRSSTIAPHPLRRGAWHLSARRSRQSANVIYGQALISGHAQIRTFASINVFSLMQLLPARPNRTAQVKAFLQKRYGLPLGSSIRFFIIREEFDLLREKAADRGRSVKKGDLCKFPDFLHSICPKRSYNCHLMKIKNRFCKTR